MTTPNIGLTTLSNSQGQYLNANEALMVIDAILAKTVKSRGGNTPPGSPSNGDNYIVGTSPTGLWSGQANKIAFWFSDYGAWWFVTPKEGWKYEPLDEDVIYRFDGTSWALYGGGFAGGTLSAALNEAPAVTLASAATVNIGAAAANTINITGTTTITAFDSIAASAKRLVVFSGALTLTHNATSLILPGTANITTAAGDTAELVSLGSGNWRCVRYQRASGRPLVASAQVIQLACSDETTVLATGVKLTFRMPYAMTNVTVRGSLTTAQTSGSLLTFDVLESGVSIFSTKPTFDNTEKTTTTAATAPVISDSSLADDAEITISITQVGDGTAKGLKVTIIGTPA